jgi:hypothetical protein
MVNGRISRHVGLNAQFSRCGRHHCDLRGSDAVESLTAFEKSLERNDFARRVERHSSSGGLDEELKRRTRKIPREGCRSSGKRNHLSLLFSEQHRKAAIQQVVGQFESGSLPSAFTSSRLPSGSASATAEVRPSGLLSRGTRTRESGSSGSQKGGKVSRPALGNLRGFRPRMLWPSSGAERKSCASRRLDRESSPDSAIRMATPILAARRFPR